VNHLRKKGLPQVFLLADAVGLGRQPPLALPAPPDDLVAISFLEF